MRHIQFAENVNMTALTVRQESFVENYVLCGNGSEAARLAGYSAKTARQIATENLSKPAVLEAVRQRQASNAETLRLTKNDVIAEVLNAIQMAREQQNPSVMISGCVQLAKLCGFYEPEVHHVQMSGDGARIKAKFAGMSDDELVALIEGKISLGVVSA